MKKLCIIVFSIAVLAAPSFAQQKMFDWVRANDESVQLDPSDYHAGRVYRPGPDGGNLHVDIQARQPVTITMAFNDQWTNALQHPETISKIDFNCLREHVLSATFECHLPPDRPMVLLVRDERTPDHAILSGIGAILGPGGARQFISPNDVHIQYFSWACVQNCVQPQFEWIRLVKEKYEVTSVPKIYNLLTPEYDGQQLNLKIKAPSPMTIAVVPSKTADRVFDDPQTLRAALDNTTCKQRGVQSLTFDCTFNLADGPQSIIVVPDPGFPPHKKAEVQLLTDRCVANCNLAK